MRVLIQVVNKAKIEIDNKIFSKIKEGYLIFVGFTHEDNEEIIEKMVNKIVGLRILPDENYKTNLSILDLNGEILSVSQFTLYANTNKGRRPSFTDSLSGELSSKLYDSFNLKLKEQVKTVKTGVFGAEMKVSLENHGPFTIYLDSKDFP